VLLPPLCEYRERLRETTRQLCLRAAQQQTGASPVAPSRPWRCGDRKRERSFSGLRLVRVVLDLSVCQLISLTHLYLSTQVIRSRDLPWRCWLGQTDLVSRLSSLSVAGVFLDLETRARPCITIPSYFPWLSPSRLDPIGRSICSQWQQR
jgi:hypothetical protein